MHHFFLSWFSQRKAISEVAGFRQIPMGLFGLFPNGKRPQKLFKRLLVLPTSFLDGNSVLNAIHSRDEIPLRGHFGPIRGMPFGVSVRLRASLAQSGASKLPKPNGSGHIDRCSERHSDKAGRCHQIDGKQGAFSGHARGRQSPVDLANLRKDISMSYLTQIQPS